MTDSAASIRAFTAVPISAEAKGELREGQAALRSRVRGVTWVRPENFHVTLQFLGSIPASSIGDWSEAIEDVTVGVEPFRMRIEGIGTFPPKRPARVLWAGISVGRDEMEDLFRRLSARLQESGYRPEGRPFHPHVTLGRIREPRRTDGLADALARGTGAKTLEQRVSTVHLVRSRLGPGGAIYDTLVAVPLGEARTGDHPTDISEDPS